jgi:hypothetical protein
MAKKSRKNNSSNKGIDNLKRSKKKESNLKTIADFKDDIPHNNTVIQNEEVKVKKLKTGSQQENLKYQELEENLRKERLKLQDIKKRLEAKEKEFIQKNESLIKEEELFKQKEKYLKKREDEYLTKLRFLESDSEKLRKREQNIQESEIKREEGFTKERKALDDELLRKRIDFDEEHNELRLKRMTKLDEQIEKEYDMRLKNLEEYLNKEREKTENELSKQKSDFETLVVAERSEIKEKIDDLKSKEQNRLDADDDLKFNTARMNSREEKLDQREEGINYEVTENTKARKLSFEKEVESFKREIERLNYSISQQREIFGIYDELKQKLGGEEPEKVLLELNLKTQEIKNLKEELINRPTQEIREKYKGFKNENTRLNKKVDTLQVDYNKLQTKFRDQREIEMQLTELKGENKSLTRKCEIIEGDNTYLSSELKRLTVSFERKQDKEKQIELIESPYLQKGLDRAESGIDEIEWLKSIEKKCEKFEFKFHPRILKSFHTALKTAEFSPLTILSGVSGTGKSELPRLYSYFGGINFLSIAVEPNWDSPESMLGFFNSIDNKFDAQPLLRLLAQTQKSKSVEYPCGLQDALTLILLDEMNLAHVELYFSDFLSKLELRRGVGKNDLPNIDIKLGAGYDPYLLPLGRNILWTGTMNQDETTKSLSDKVLDRGIEIHFPRPTQLISKKKMIPIDKIGKSPLLSLKDWNNWKQWESKFTDEEIKPFKAIIEEININLTNVGRALGHRVWQSIEYYLANYPDVIVAKKKNDKVELEKAMRLAFEDQLVQKVMPKLRGIETRGKSRTECLDKIKAQFVENEYSIVEDFDFACEYGYGHFMWNSAKYLDDKTINSSIFEDKIKEDSDNDLKSNEEETETKQSLDNSDLFEENSQSE